jgi:hypothetical protein
LTNKKLLALASTVKEQPLASPQGASQ